MTIDWRTLEREMADICRRRAGGRLDERDGGIFVEGSISLLARDLADSLNDKAAR